MKGAFAAVALCACVSAAVHAAERGDAPFVVSYRCDGGQLLAVGYPAYRDAAKARIRLSWQDKTVELAPARSGSGARYVSAAADLEWWNKGNGGTLYSLTRHQPLATGCVEL